MVETALPGYLERWRALGRHPKFGKTGSLPAPLDARNGSDLTGQQGSHPLAFVELPTLLRPTTTKLAGGFTIEPGSAVGGEIRGRLHLEALESIEARAARISVKGYLLREQDRSSSSGSGDLEQTEHWVEIVAEALDELPLIETVLPLHLAAGASLDLAILAPAPRLGPPSAHVGAGAVVWLLVAEWDIPMGGDERIAAIVTIDQPRDLVISGVIDLGPSALLDHYSVAGATFTIDPAPPLHAGEAVAVHVAWPQASGGRGARIELHADVDGRGGVCLDTIVLPTSELSAGTSVRFTLPLDAPPVFQSSSLTVSYRIRALIDRPLLPDRAAERQVAVISPRR